MRIIRNKTHSLASVVFNITSSILLTFSLTLTQVSYAQGNRTEEVLIPKTNNQFISSNTSKRLHAFFNNSAEVSIQRYNQQLLEVTIGGRSVFASNDGRYLYVGKVIDTQEKIDISEKIAQSNRLKQLANLEDEYQLSFPATAKELFEVTLFTDIDCGYCRRFHGNLVQYNALGIRVNYVMLPRAGKNSASYNKTAAVLCSSNPQANMTLAMQGQFLAPTSSVDTQCKNNLNQQMLLASKLGITATPTMLLANGSVIEGVVKPKQLLAQLKQAQAVEKERQATSNKSTQKKAI
jgi:thiol:disulfide interchange protein DsbC